MMELADIGRLAAELDGVRERRERGLLSWRYQGRLVARQLDGVRERRERGLLSWRYQGRLVARQLDDTHVVVRASFDVRDVFLHSFPATFSVPPRYAKHMMVVADLANGDRDAIEEAVIAAWRLQRGEDPA